LGLAGLLVQREVVERVTGVGDLQPSVASLARAEQLAVRAGDRLRPALGDQRGPVLDTVALAGALRAPVVGPDVERLAMGVDEDPPEAARPALDDRVTAGRERRSSRNRHKRKHDHADDQPHEVRQPRGHAVWEVVHWKLLPCPDATLRSVATAFETLRRVL